MTGIRFRTAIATAALLWLGAQSRLAAAAASPEDLEFFESQVRPILAESCYKCHSTESGKSKASLRLDTRDSVVRGGESGVVLVPGDPDKSLLIAAVRYKDEDLRMPPEDDGGQ